MDFFDREARSQKQTKWLFWLFGFGVVVACVFNYLILKLVIQPFLSPDVQTHLGLWIALGTLVSIVLGCFYKARQLSAGGPTVAEMLGGRRIESRTSNPNEKKLCDVIEEMAIASGMAVPAVYVLDNERGLNSFAAGHTRDDVAIGVTRGCVVLLSRDEMQGVVAHEFSHVLNGDTRINMRLMVLLHGLIWPTIVGRALIQAVEPIDEDESIFEQTSTTDRMFLVPFAFVFWLIGAPGLFLSRFMKSAICRKREWLADAAAVQFTRNPAGIEGALKKVGGLLKQGRIDAANAETASHLYFVNSAFDPWFGFTSTHPPLNKRILAIDPTFDGAFQHIMSLSRPEIEQAADYDRKYLANVQRAKENAKVRQEYE